jgi:hypothetical protein
VAFVLFLSVFPSHLSFLQKSRGSKEKENEGSKRAFCGGLHVAIKTIFQSAGQQFFKGRPTRRLCNRLRKMGFCPRDKPKPKVSQPTPKSPSEQMSPQNCRRLTRLTNAFSKKLENFKAAVALHYAYYNFFKSNIAIRCMPAIAAGVANTFWTVRDLVEMIEA